VLILIFYFFASGLFQAVGALIAGIELGALVDVKIIGMKDIFVIQSFGFIGVLLVVFLFRKYSDLRSIRSMGFQIKVKDTIWGMLVAGAILSIGTIILVMCKEIFITNINFNSTDLLYGFLLFIGVAFSEEIICRGYILNNLMVDMNKYFALAISSLIFALMHSFNSNLCWSGMIELFIAGMLLGSTYIYTKNLWFSISLHLFWNFIQGCIFDYNVSGLNVSSILTFDTPLKNTFNGGDFGFEGSWLCTLLSSFAILIILYYYNRHSKTVHINQAANI
jgi:hypothetical protein